MTSAADKLAAELADLKRQVAALSRSAQLGRSSVQVDGEAVRVVDGIRSGVEAKTLATVALSTADGKNKVTYSVLDPFEDGTTVGDIWFKRDAVTRVITASWEWDGSEWQPVTFDDAVLASLTVGKLVTGEIAAGERIIAGPANSNHAELTDSGLYLYAKNPDGQAVEVGRFGTDGTDRLLLTDGTGKSVASIDGTGRGNFTGLNVDGDPVFNGTTLGWLFFTRPKGILLRAGADSSFPATATSRGAFEGEFIAEPGRSYRITTSTINLNPSTPTTYSRAWILARPSAEGSPVLGSGRTLVTALGSSNIAGGVFPVTLSKTIHFDELFLNNTPPNGQVPTRVRLLLAYGVVSGGGTAALYGTTEHPVHMYVEDVGPTNYIVSIANDGTGSTGGGYTYTTWWADTWAANWYGNGLSTARRTDTAEIVQGYSASVPEYGSGIGQTGFGNGVRQGDGVAVSGLTTELEGATIRSARLFIYSTFWGSDVAGTVLLGTHSDAAPPVTRPTNWTLNRLTSSGHPEPGGLWVTLPSNLWGGLQTGAIRGFTFGDGVSTGPVNNGRIVGDPADARRLVLEVVYAK